MEANFNPKFEEMKSELKEAITQEKSTAASTLGIADTNETKIVALTEQVDNLNYQGSK